MGSFWVGSGPRDWPKSRFLTWKNTVSGGPRRKWIFFLKKIPFFRQRVKKLWKVSQKKRRFFGLFFTFFRSWFFGFLDFTFFKSEILSFAFIIFFHEKWKILIFHFFWKTRVFQKFAFFKKRMFFVKPGSQTDFFFHFALFFQKKKVFLRVFRGFFKTTFFGVFESLFFMPWHEKSYRKVCWNFSVFEKMTFFHFFWVLTRFFRFFSLFFVIFWSGHDFNLIYFHFFEIFFPFFALFFTFFVFRANFNILDREGHFSDFFIFVTINAMNFG